MFHSASTGTVDLNSLVTENLAGLTLVSASAINDSGVIVGTAVVNGRTTGFYAEPVPEPASLAIVAGLALLLRQRKRS